MIPEISSLLSMHFEDQDLPAVSTKFFVRITVIDKVYS